LSHREIQQLLGAYALDAVDDDERDAIELHLATCPRCRAEVMEDREVAAFLGHTGGPAPSGLWDRIAASLEEAPPPLALAPVTPMGAARRARWSRWALVATSAAAVVALALGLAVAVSSRSSHRDTLQEQAIEARDRSDARVADLRSAEGRLAAQAVLLPDGRGYLLQTDLPRLDRARTYQLWALVGNEAISAGVLGPDPKVATFTLHVPPSALGFAITDEVAGGVAQPQHKPLVSGRLRST